MGFFSPGWRSKRSLNSTLDEGSPYALHCGVISDVTAVMCRHLSAPLGSSFPTVGDSKSLEGQGRRNDLRLPKKKNKSESLFPGDPERPVLSLHWSRPAAVAAGHFWWVKP